MKDMGNSGRLLRAELSMLFRYGLQQKRIIESGFPDAFVAPGCAEMTATHVGLQQQDVGVRLVIAQLRGPFGGLPILHTSIVLPRGDQQVRIVFALYVVIR